VSGELLRVALTKLAAARERPYLDEDADREAAAVYYADIEPGFESLSTLVESTHRHKPGYSPADELYPWIDLQPDGKLRSLYTEEQWEPEELIEEAAELESQRATLRASAATDEAQVEEMLAYNCEHVVPQSWFEHDEPMRGDLHHLFTCERKCNSFRGTTDFPDYLQVVRESCGRARARASSRGEGKARPRARRSTSRCATPGSASTPRRRWSRFSTGTRPNRPTSTSATGTLPSRNARETGTR
jgi:endonuclease G, mitochondrial